MNLYETNTVQSEYFIHYEYIRINVVVLVYESNILIETNNIRFD